MIEIENPNIIRAVIRYFTHPDKGTPIGRPFIRGGRIYATDGRIMVRASVPEGWGREANDNKTINSAERIFKRVWDPEGSGKYESVDLSRLENWESENPMIIPWFGWRDWKLNLIYGQQIHELFGADVEFLQEDWKDAVERQAAEDPALQWRAGPFEGLWMPMRPGVGESTYSGIHIGKAVEVGGNGAMTEHCPPVGGRGGVR